MIDSILIALDDDLDRSLPVIEHAAEIAGALGTHVTLFHVYDEDNFNDQLDEFDVDSADPNTLVKRNNTMRRAADELQSHDITYDLKGAVGNPAEEIITYVENNDIDHVFMGGRHRSPTGKAVLGSVSQQVLLSSERPCTILVSDQ